MRLQERQSGTLVLTARVTLARGHDDWLIDLIEAAPDGQLATVLRELMRHGIESMGDLGADTATLIAELLKCEQHPSAGYRAVFRRSPPTYRGIRRTQLRAASSHNRPARGPRSGAQPSHTDEGAS